MAHTAIAHLVGSASYSQSRSYDRDINEKGELLYPKLPRETADAYEDRTWRNKCHIDSKTGNVFIPPMAFKMALDAAAKMLGRQIPGKGKSTYTKFFNSGVLCMEPIILPVTKETVARDRIYANADGVRGSGKRVWRNFPRIDNWEADVPFQVLADEITEDVFTEHLKQAGSFVGIGRFRPQSAGYYGRFKVTKIKWQPLKMD